MSSASALPNQILWIPDVKMLREDVCRFDMQDLVTLSRKSSDTPGGFYGMAFGGNCGVYASEQVRIEAGLDWKESHDYAITSLTDGLFAQFQVQLFDIDERHWGLSLGAYDVGTKSGTNNFNVFYFMAQHQAGVYRFGLGAYGGNGQILLNGDGKAESQGLLIGIWKKIENGDIGFEWQTGYNRYGYMFLGARKIISQRTYATLGYGIANDTKLMRDVLLVKLGYVF